MLPALLAAALSENAYRWDATEFVASPSFGAGETEPSGSATGLIIGIVISAVIGIIGLVIAIIASIKCVRPVLLANSRKDENDDELDDIFDE